ncbi:hypothetical protein SAMN05216551_10165 [Chitinasiproducens palmae]|uniref:Uncharacterized protein n=2 Tax=Chitinasiproducens palmae TaxID=1770053 RepID=A0A1H2PIJ7_9BURK|nr:hypothetical protein SAMN05216551_10165 [Chitinasiproducens palmae]
MLLLVAIAYTLGLSLEQATKLSVGQCLHAIRERTRVANANGSLQSLEVHFLAESLAEHLIARGIPPVLCVDDLAQVELAAVPALGAIGLSRKSATGVGTTPHTLRQAFRRLVTVADPPRDAVIAESPRSGDNSVERFRQEITYKALVLAGKHLRGSAT